MTNTVFRIGFVAAPRAIPHLAYAGTLVWPGFVVTIVATGTRWCIPHRSPGIGLRIVPVAIRTARIVTVIARVIAAMAVIHL